MFRVLEIFYRFLVLGCVSFGGPAAHIGYFQTAFVEKLKWIDQDSYAKLVALSQFLPGPGSSQVGFAIGLRRAGLLGGVAAFLGFTLPSFLLLYLLTTFNFNSSDTLSGIVYGLKLLAVIVVADACYTMFSAFCKNRITILISLGSAILLLLFPGLFVQLGVLVLAALLGVFLLGKKTKPVLQTEVSRIKKIPLSIFIVILFALPWLNQLGLTIFSSFYYAGSLVFGGGHVVLPLLQQAVGDSLSTDQFLTGYAAAQAVPGPMFSLAAYLGAELSPEHQFVGALLATLGIFLPGFLLIIGLYRAWETLASKPKISGATTGINASVVGILLAALYQPIFLSAVNNLMDFILVTIGLVTLRVLKAPILLLVFSFVILGILRSI